MKDFSRFLISNFKRGSTTDGFIAILRGLSCVFRLTLTNLGFLTLNYLGFRGPKPPHPPTGHTKPVKPCL